MTDVLVLEKDACQSYLYYQALTQEGFAVWLVDNMRDAVDLARVYHPDIVVLDLQRPEAADVNAVERLLDIAPTLTLIIYTPRSSYVVFPATAHNNDRERMKRGLSAPGVTTANEVKTILAVSKRVAAYSRELRVASSYQSLLQRGERMVQ